MPEYVSSEFESSSDALKLPPELCNFFPEISNLFEANQNLFDELMPLVSFDLEVVNNQWKGINAVILLYYNDCGDYPGAKYFNEYCDDYQIAWKLNDKGKFVFLTETGFFEASEGYEQFKIETKSLYLEAKNNFKNKILPIEWNVPMDQIIRQLNSEPYWIQNQVETNLKFICQLDAAMFDSDYYYLFFDSENRIFYQIVQYD